jgi:hypothetical protein
MTTSATPAKNTKGSLIIRYVRFRTASFLYNILPSTMQLTIALFPSHNMFRPYTAIIKCVQFAKIVALYGMSNFSSHI